MEIQRDLEEIQEDILMKIRRSVEDTVKFRQMRFED
jgi:hypothetical protein